MFAIVNSRPWVLVGTVLALCVAAVSSLPAKEQTVDELKAKVSNTAAGDRPALCIQISEMQLNAADKLYAEGSDENAIARLADVEAFAQLARDYAIQTHKHEKQSEIAIRKMIRKLIDIKRLVGHDEQKPIQDAIDGLQQVRDDLLRAMFPKGKAQ